MDAVTAVSGSGPAYVFLLAEALAQAGTAAGLPAALAARLARATVAGSGELMGQQSLDPATLRQNVTSPGGTTAAALEVLMGTEGLASLMTKAVAAATRRSRELAGMHGLPGTPARIGRPFRDRRANNLRSPPGALEAPTLPLHSRINPTGDRSWRAHRSGIRSSAIPSRRFRIPAPAPPVAAAGSGAVPPLRRPLPAPTASGSSRPFWGSWRCSPIEEIERVEIAARAGVSLATLRGEFGSPLAILAAHLKDDRPRRAGGRRCRHGRRAGPRAAVRRADAPHRGARPASRSRALAAAFGAARSCPRIRAQRPGAALAALDAHRRRDRFRRSRRNGARPRARGPVRPRAEHMGA